ncbi:PDC sensor domain-containing protein [Ciceribacter sp. L1K22]|uniref:PDC sensor domain-containing protein n=1 Tax=Ciceribacter sp. L1K22 TaxID=2820275 RepID=UPI001ABDBE5E|nr:PDC sensor domain-containing protein [Ciceribacter sp. L1K22]MBO3759985.1 cache domain-containing protein [Ciceribacter sp. L1K22]
MPRRLSSAPRRPKLILVSLAVLLPCLLAGALMVPHSFGTQDSVDVSHEQLVQIETFMHESVRPWLSDPLLAAAITAQNVENADLTDAEIDALDRAWRNDVAAGGSPTIEAMLARPLSRILQNRQEGSAHLITEIIVTDRHGLNVAQSTVSTDLWQGDEAKFTRTYGQDEDFVLVEKLELDESTQRRQVHASMPITDASGRPIGVITLGIDLEALDRLAR